MYWYQYKQSCEYGATSRSDVIEKEIETFFLREDVSRVTPDTKKSAKNPSNPLYIQPISYQLGPLKVLFSKYCSESTSNISYVTFCRHVPFYITSPSATDWGNCLCSTFMIQFNHLIFTIHNYFINLNRFSKKCPVRNTELRGYFCIFCIPLCKVLLCYKFRNLQKFFIYSKVWSFIRVIGYKIEKLRFLDIFTPEKGEIL